MVDNGHVSPIVSKGKLIIVFRHGSNDSEKNRDFLNHFLN